MFKVAMCTGELRAFRLKKATARGPEAALYWTISSKMHFCVCGKLSCQTINEPALITLMTCHRLD
jgi:hypothetical protein